MHCINECDESHPISLVGVGGRGSSIWVVAEKLKGAWNSWRLSWICYHRYRLNLHNMTSLQVLQHLTRHVEKRACDVWLKVR